MSEEAVAMALNFRRFTSRLHAASLPVTSFHFELPHVETRVLLTYTLLSIHLCFELCLDSFQVPGILTPIL